MNKNLIQLIIKTITVGNVFEAISKKYNITDGGGYGENQLFNFYPKEYSRGSKQLFVDINSSVSDLNDQQINILNELIK